MSIHVALSLLGLGSSGKTSNEIWSSLHLDLPPVSRQKLTEEFAQLLNDLHRNPLINIASELFVRDDLQCDSNFTKMASTSFGSSVQSISFADSQKAASIINEWVSTKTMSQINDLIAPDSLSTDTMMFIVNTIYFKGDWETSFDPSENHKGIFHMANGKTKNEVEMMRMDEFVRYTEISELDSKVIELPYMDSNMSMVFILPNTVNGLSTLEKQFPTFDVMAMRKAFITSAKSPKVFVSLPKFKVEFQINLENVLKKVTTNQNTFNLLNSLINISLLLDGNGIHVYTVCRIFEHFVESAQ